MSGQGTVFHSAGSQGERKKWLAGRLTVKGHISVDAGAAKALAGGNSLLPAGVLTVAGEFARGDVVDIKDETGHVVARGLSEYERVDAIKIICCRRSEERRVGKECGRTVRSRWSPDH